MQIVYKKKSKINKFKELVFSLGDVFFSQKKDDSDLFKKYRSYTKEALSFEILESCENGDLKTVKYLSKHPKIDNANIKNISDNPLETACKYGHLGIVEYLLTSPETKSIYNVNDNNSLCFKNACKYGHLEIVKYLLTSPDLKEHSNINDDDDYGIRWACKNEHLEVVKYLLTSSDLKKHSNIYAKRDTAFKWLYENWTENKNNEILKFLIFDYNIVHTKDIKNCIKGNINEINNFFELREVNKQLHNDLTIKQNKTKKMKI